MLATKIETSSFASSIKGSSASDEPIFLLSNNPSQ
jgi:hypothetical protein